MSFYETLATEYDAMTRFEDRFEKEKDFFVGLKDRYGLSKVLDAGCGTGFHSILLARLGLHVTGIDSSPEMLKLAQNNAEAFHVKAEFHHSSFQQIELPDHNVFDAVFCMGNSLPHLLTENDVIISLNNFHDVLRENGILVVQNLNYDRIMKDRERIVSITKHGDRTFVRFYDFKDGLVDFNVLIIDEGRENLSHRLIATELKPLYHGDLQRWLDLTGFQRITIKGDLLDNDYNSDYSTNLIIIAQKLDHQVTC